MVEFKEKRTEVQLEGVTVEQFINPKLLEKIRKYTTIRPVAIALLSERESEEKDAKGKLKKYGTPIVLQHQSESDFTKKILKVSCEDDPDTLEKVILALKEL